MHAIIQQRKLYSKTVLVVFLRFPGMFAFVPYGTSGLTKRTVTVITTIPLFVSYRTVFSDMNASTLRTD
jgi:hypothetical protein